jgi:ankyrin repeat protein
MPPKKKKIVKKKKKHIELPPIKPDLTLPNIPSSKSATLLWAVSSSDRDAVARLVYHYDYGSELDTLDENGSTLIHLAVKRSDVTMVQQLLQYRRIDLDRLEKRSIGGYSALHHACMQNNQQLVQLLLENGASPSVQSDSELGDSPLHLCCRMGFTAAAAILLRFGANVTLKDHFVGLLWDPIAPDSMSFLNLPHLP